ncbi:DUF72 domain-containing protein [Candidatus Methylacidithermus pantelleriae]|uniref:DUF72 domain-containing protein n=1 Tax=Candidatus Methylacidithermus pantelleriae TaxID=2744239 RepID=A0A8J2FNE2_9BACT|nr:DUF72 domain-containing protein [Candidatus Methylacidithermus pantelleriae]CAF0691895.1 conserved hypothetical protein [Candidatus Methylacidithermus pantelleriae]
MSKIFIGTASWTDPTLLESGWYPPEVSTAEERLRYYARSFSLVEVDATFYALPSLRNVQAWVNRTPAGFRFDVKAFRAFTQHWIPPESLPRDLRSEVGSPPRETGWYLEELGSDVQEELWRRFVTALEPLRAGAKLGVLLFQFPPWFVCRSIHRTWVERCVDRLQGFSLAIEFRHKSWWEGVRGRETLRWERELGVVNVVVDEPQGFPSSVPAVWEATSHHFAMVRLHGRNRETWVKKGLSTAAERFKYLYTEEELGALIDPILRLSHQVTETHVIFNNCYRDYGVRNASQCQEILTRVLHQSDKTGQA